MAHILAICEDEAFALTLKEALELQGDHEVTLARTTEEARRAVERGRIELAIVDADLQDASPAELVLALRRMRPGLRVMWMPFFGQPLDGALLTIDAQGTLTKPFFIEDLPQAIATALAKPVGEVQVDDVQANESSQPVSLAHECSPNLTAAKEEAKGLDPALEQRLTKLCDTLNAEQAFVLDAEGRLHAWTGFGARHQAEVLANALAAEWAAACQVATALQEKHGPFLASLHEGEEYRLVTLFLPDLHGILAVVTRRDIPLGTVWYQVKRAAAELSDLRTGGYGQ